MTKEEKLAEKSWESAGAWYNASADYYSYVDGFIAGLEVNVKELSTETLLKELIDRKVIRSWYYNGTYHVGNELPKGE
jgi:hypothetical protein